MIRERGTTVRVMASSSSESLTGDVESRNSLGKVRAGEKHIFPGNQLQAVPLLHEGSAQVSERWRDTVDEGTSWRGA